MEDVDWRKNMIPFMDERARRTLKCKHKGVHKDTRALYTKLIPCTNTEQCAKARPLMHAHLHTWWNKHSDAPVLLSKVQSETLLARDLFVVSHCYCVYRFIPFYRRKTSSSLCYSTTNPSLSLLSLFFSFTFYCVFFPLEGKVGYIFFVFFLPYLSSSISRSCFPNLLS